MKTTRFAARMKTMTNGDSIRTWQPIETAPTDGTRILLCGRGGKIADGHYGQPDGWANPKRFVWPYIHANPTHWMPLPAPPIGRCIPCRETGALHCHDPLHCGGPWSEAPQNVQGNRPLPAKGEKE